MIPKTYILQNLKSLEFQYNRAKSQKAPLFFSKLALLELCGWIEESMDELIILATRGLREPANAQYVVDQVIRMNHGFSYKSNFRPMLVKAIGIKKVEWVEATVATGTVANLSSALGTLKAARDNEAHTHIKGTARSIDSPSITLTRFTAVYTCLKEYERVIRLL